jgi:hypothetical protein
MKADHNMLENEFIDMLNDEYPPVNLAGFEYSFGYALKELDPIRLNVMYNDYLSMLKEEEEYES